MKPAENLPLKQVFFTNNFGADTMSDVKYAVECISVTEIPGRDAVVVLNEDLFSPLREDPDEFTGLIRSFCVMARAQLSQDLASTDSNSLVPVSDEKRLSGVVMEIVMALGDDGGFVLLTRYGGRVDPGKSLREALMHAMEVVSVVESQYS